ncbi:MAG: methyltransferase [Proteobacteria bacterium]|nr:methyltransferase [Pseudomonadota bacterium]
MNEKIGKDETLDILCNEGLKIIQKKEGYRFSIDAILLANFIILKKDERLLDIGTGCGIIPIYISKKGYKNYMVGIEIQEELLCLAIKNKALNKCEHIQFLNGDIKSNTKELKKTQFHVIVSNPPYTKESTGRRSPKHSRFIARYESSLNLADLISTSSALLHKGGRLYVIYPSKRLGELIHTAREKRLEPKRLRFIHSKKEEKSNLFLTEFIKEGGIGTTVEQPLYIYENGGYTEEIKTYYTLKACIWKA